MNKNEATLIFGSYIVKSLEHQNMEYELPALDIERLN